MKVCRDAPSISNLLFADDSLIQMQDDGENAACMKHILDEYYQTSGQLVSTSKSSVLFSPNTKVDIRDAICTSMDFMTEALTNKYLGIPTMVGADRSDSFSVLRRPCMPKNQWVEGEDAILWR
jgi:hypothetical protein